MAVEPVRDSSRPAADASRHRPDRETLSRSRLSSSTCRPPCRAARSGGNRRPSPGSPRPVADPERGGEEHALFAASIRDAYHSSAAMTPRAEDRVVTHGRLPSGSAPSSFGRQRVPRRIAGEDGPSSRGTARDAGVADRRDRHSSGRRCRPRDVRRAGPDGHRLIARCGR